MTKFFAMVSFVLGSMFATGCLYGADSDTPTPTVTPAPSASVPTDTGVPQNDATPATDSGSEETATDSGVDSDANETTPVDSGVTTDAATDSDAADTSPDTGAVAPAARIVDYDVEAHKSAIVIGGKDAWQPFVAYMLCAGSEEDVTLSSVMVTSGGDNMDNADFTAVGIMSYGAILGQGVLPPGKTGSVNVDLTTPIWAPKGGACTPFQIVAKVAAVSLSSSDGDATSGVCRSGHSPSLGLSADASSMLKVTVTGKTSGAKISVPSIDAHFGNPMVIRRSVPIFTKMPLSSTTLGNYDQDLYKDQVAADGGAIALKQRVYHVVKTGDFSIANWRLRRGSLEMSPTQYKIVEASAPFGTTLADSDLKTGDVIVTFTDQEEIMSSGNVYTLHATVSGAMSGCAVVIQPKNDVGDLSSRLATGKLVPAGSSPWFLSITDAPFPVYQYQYTVWSDLSAAFHKWQVGDASAPLSSADWTNGLLLQDLSSSQVLWF